MSDNQTDNHILPTPTSNDSSGQVVAPQQTNPLQLSESTQHPSANQTDLPIRADDIDLIEKEWVTKAKSIVLSTVGDPRRQSSELNKMKSQYISKRFNKELPGNG